MVTTSEKRVDMTSTMAMVAVMASKAKLVTVPAAVVVKVSLHFATRESVAG